MRFLTLLLLLCIACAESPGPLRPAGPAASAPATEPAKSADLDGDGYSTPEDCLDEGYLFATQGASPCDGLTRHLFIPHDGLDAKDCSVVEDNGTIHVFHIRSDERQ